MQIVKSRPTLVPILCLFVAFLVLASQPRGAQAKVFEPETFTLDNGLEVVVVANRRAPIVTHMLWYKVGAADEPPGKSGIAHFLEHLMFKGTDTLGPGEFSDIIARNGGQENAFTSYDYTGYFQTVAKDRLDIIMKYEADRMTNLTLSDEVVLPERDVVLEERRSRIDREPGAQLGEALRDSRPDQRGRDRLLPALVRAQQRGSDRGRGCGCRGGARPCGDPLRGHSRARGAGASAAAGAASEWRGCASRR
jgi:hypothetical protein